MAYDSLAELVSMNGHGLFVWLAYLCGFTVLMYNLLAPRLQGRSIRARLRRQLEREDRA